MVSYRYYYFVPQLSCLAYGQQPPMSSLAFREKAAPMLDAKDAALLGFVGLDVPLSEPTADGDAPKAKGTGCEFIDGWREWEKALRLSLARLRASGMGREDGEAESGAPGFPSSASEAAARAMHAETPLEGEVILDKARWDAVEALQGSDLFHRKTVFAYLMKLIILERQASFQAETGFAEYKTLYDSILERWDSEPSGAASMGEAK